MRLLDPEIAAIVGELLLTDIDGGLDPVGDPTDTEVLIELSLDLQECCLEVNKFGINSFICSLGEGSATLALLLLLPRHPYLSAEFDMTQQRPLRREKRRL